MQTGQYANKHTMTLVGLDYIQETALGTALLSERQRRASSDVQQDRRALAQVLFSASCTMQEAEKQQVKCVL